MSDLIPASKACIGYNLDDNFGVAEIKIMHLDDARGSQRGWWNAAQMTFGAVFTDWMKEGYRNLTPEFVFSEMLTFNGFRNSLVAEQALSEFAKIDTCEWARAMVPHNDKNELNLNWTRKSIT